MSQKKAQLLNPLNGNLNVTGVVTATSFAGNLTGNVTGNVTGTATTATALSGTPDITVNNIVAAAATFSGNVSIAGTLTYEDVTNVDSIGVITARNGINVLAGGISAVGVITATSFSGDGSQLQGVVSGVEVLQAGSSVGTSITAINFAAGATLTGGSGFSTVTIAAGIQTEAATPNNTIQFLDLSAAQDHKLTISGITTISVTGGTEGDSHTVRIVNSGIATVGFSTYFLWPSGSPPSLPTADGAKSLISFTVNRVGGAGTELFAGASVNYS